MAYDEKLADRVRDQLAPIEQLAELKMFGGIGWTIRGNMCVGVMEDELIVRVGADAYDDALADARTREFDFTGRPMSGWVLVDPSGITTAKNLDRWVARGVDFASSLPPKSAKSTTSTKQRPRKRK